MITVIQEWFRRYFSDPEVAILALLLVFGFASVILFGGMLAPVLAAIVIAYLLEGLIEKLTSRGMQRFLSLMVVFLAFMALYLFVLFGLMPLLSRQATELVQLLPTLVGRGQKLLIQLPEMYPQFITETQIRNLMAGVQGELLAWGQKSVSLSLASLVSVVTLLVYLFLVPLLVFFFLKDKSAIISWVTRYLPRERGLAAKVWLEVDLQIGNYVRGKFWEVIIVGVATYLGFAYMGLNFAPLLALLVGLSVIIPYVGVTIVTIPVAIIAYYQWGFTTDMAWLMGIYFVIQALDGVVLVPLLFSEVNNLHPIAIIVAVLMFGGLWGLWGVFFAIPLATLVQAVLNAWPNVTDAIAEVEAE